MKLLAAIPACLPAGRDLMKKAVLVILLFLIAAGAAWAFNFYQKNFQGVGPAFRKPPRDITETINTTGMPLTLPAGFSISIFAKDLGNPRVLSQDPSGNIIVSITSGGKVVMLPDRNADGEADETIILLEGLNKPHGLAVRCTEKCQLYVAETDKVKVYDYEYDEARKLHRPVNGRKIIDLPTGGNHFTRTILFLPEPNDHRLLTSAGSSCNVCEERDSRRAKILVSNADGSDLKVFAQGLRNSVFMAVHPVTKKIWATEMGRDLLGDNLPPDEINIIAENKFYGWPWYYGKSVRDRSFQPNVALTLAQELVESHIDIPAHSAPLGLAFFPPPSADLRSGKGWPEEFRDDLLVAYHGSWNRSEPTGYKIVRFLLDEQGNQTGPEEDFISGWLPPGGGSEGALGRPVDILMLADGSMYISDDKAGVIYRLTYPIPDSKIIINP